MKTKSGFFCALFAPAALRAQLMILYNFNLEIARVREMVSDPIVGQLRLKWWYDALAGMAAGEVPRHPLALALNLVIDAGCLDVMALQRLVEVRAADLTPQQPTDGTALASYAAATAGEIHDVALQLLGAGSVEAARHLSNAWAYTGLMRSLPHHAARGWLYLPKEICVSVGLDPVEALRTRPGRASAPALKLAVQTVAELASVELVAARRLRAKSPKSALPVLLLAVLADDYLKQLQAHDFDPALLPHGQSEPRPATLLRLGWYRLWQRY